MSFSIEDNRKHPYISQITLNCFYKILLVFKWMLLDCVSDKIIYIQKYPKMLRVCEWSNERNNENTKQQYDKIYFSIKATALVLTNFQFFSNHCESLGRSERGGASCFSLRWMKDDDGAWLWMGAIDFQLFPPDFVFNGG